MGWKDTITKSSGKSWKDTITKSPADQKISELESAGAGFVKGGTLGFDDEMGGAVQAFLDSISSNSVSDVDKKLAEQGFKGDLLPSSAAVGKQAIKENRAEDKVYEEANPTAYGAANAIGSIIPSAAMGMGLAGNAAKYITSGKGVLGSAGSGVALGAIQGLGASEADSIPGVLADTAIGAGIGGGTGGALAGIIKGAQATGSTIKSGAEKLGKEFSDSRFGRTVLDSFNYGKNKEKVLGAQVEQSVKDELTGIAKQLGIKAKELEKGSIKRVGAAKTAIEENTTDIEGSQSLIKKLYEKAYKLSQSGDAQKRADADLIIEKLNGITQSKNYHTYQKAGEAVVNKIPASKSGSEKADELISRLTAEDDAAGVSAKYGIVPSKDGKWLTVQRIVDEPIGAPERLVPTTEQVLSDIPHAPKMGKALDNSPENLRKLQSKSAELNLKAKVENSGNRYEVLEDKQHGKYYILEHPAAKQTVETVPGAPALDAGNSEHLFKSSLNQRSIPNTPGVAASEQIVPGPMQDVVSEAMSTKTSLTPADLLNLKDEVNYLNKGGKFQSSKGAGLGKFVAGEADDAVKNLTGELAPLSKELSDANKSHTAISEILESLKLKENSKKLGSKFFTKDRNTGEMVLKPDGEGRLADFIRQVEAEAPATNLKSSSKLEYLAQRLKEVAPEEADALIPHLERVSHKFALVNRLAGKNIATQAGRAELGAAWTANKLGFGVNKINQIHNAPEGVIENITSTMMSAGGKIAELGQKMSSLKDKDSIGRNALIFSLMQDPEYRKILKEYFPGGNNDK